MCIHTYTHMHAHTQSHTHTNSQNCKIYWDPGSLGYFWEGLFVFVFGFVFFKDVFV